MKLIHAASLLAASAASLLVAGSGCSSSGSKSKSSGEVMDSCVIGNASYSVGAGGVSVPASFDYCGYGGSAKSGYASLLLRTSNKLSPIETVFIDVGATPGSAGPTATYPLGQWASPPSNDTSNVPGPAAGEMHFMVWMRLPSTGSSKDAGQSTQIIYVPKPGQTATADATMWPSASQPGSVHVVLPKIELVPDNGVTPSGFPDSFTFDAADISVGVSMHAMCDTTPIQAAGASGVSFSSCKTNASCNDPTLLCKGGQCCSLDFLSCSDDKECCTGTCSDGACGSYPLGANAKCSDSGADTSASGSGPKCIYNASTGVCFCPLHRAIKSSDYSDNPATQFLESCPAATGNCYIDTSDACPSISIADESCSCYSFVPGSNTCAVNEQKVTSCPQ